MEEQQPTNKNAPVSLGDWIVTLIVTAIPFLNIVMLLVWSFSSGTKISKQNWARAALILMAVGFVVWFIMGMFFVGMSGHMDRF